MKKRILSILLVLTIIVGMIPFSITAGASDIGTPTNLRWDGYICKWDAVDGATSYHVTLCCTEEGSVSGNPKIVSSYTTKTEIDLSSNFDYESSITYRQNYYFIVRALIGEEYGASATSGKLFYHRHDWQWNADETHHWKGCANVGCDITDNTSMPEYAEHSFVGNVCTVCDYAEHLHTYSTSYEYTDEYHWRPATCGHDEKLYYEKHTFRNNNCYCGAHKHVSRDEWRYDKNYHWHECMADGCTATSVSALGGYGKHDFVDGYCVCGFAEPIYVANATATVQTPLAGSEPIYSIVPAEPDKYTATLVCWLDENFSEMYDDDVFEAGKTYYVNVRFSSVIGYKIDANTVCEITGFTAYSYDVFSYQIPANASVHSHSWKNEWSYNSWYHWKECTNSLCEGLELHNKEGYGKHDFSSGNCVCGMEKPIMLSSVNVNITEPTIDKKPDFNLTVTGENYTATFVSWYDYDLRITMTENDHFCSGNEYVARVQFIPNDGYGFDSNTVFTINGKETWHYSSVGPDWRTITFYDVPSYPMTVTFDGNGHGSGFETQNLYRGDTVLRPEVQTDGDYRLSGWYREPECINEWDFAVDVVEENTTLYAAWVDTRISSIDFELYGYNAGGNVTSAGVTINTEGLQFATHNDIVNYTFRLIDGDANLTSGTFDGNKEYTVTAIVKVKDGYTKTFTRDTIKLNGYITPSFYRYYSGYYIIEFELPKLKNSAVQNVEVLDIDAPVAGETPDYYATLGNPFWYEFANYGPLGTGYWWYDSEGTPLMEDDKFVGGETYTLEIKISQKKDNGSIMTTFQTPVTAYLNGQAVDSSEVMANSTTVYIFATFVCEGNSEILKGDINGDDSVTATDYILAKRAVMGTYALDETKSISGDVNGDDTVTATDYILLKRAVMGTYTIG